MHFQNWPTSEHVAKLGRVSLGDLPERRSKKQQNITVFHV